MTDAVAEAAGAAGSAARSFVVIRESDLMPVARVSTKDEASAILGENEGWIAEGPTGLRDFSTGLLRQLFEHLSPKKLARNFDTQEEGAERSWKLIEKAELLTTVEKEQFGVYTVPKVVVQEDSTLIKTPYEGQQQEEKSVADTAKKAKTVKVANKGTKRGASKAKSAPKERKPGSGALIRTLICDGKSTEDILKAVKKAFPDSTAKASDVSWNRSKLRKDGVKFPGSKKD